MAASLLRDSSLVDEMNWEELEELQVLDSPLQRLPVVSANL